MLGCTAHERRRKPQSTLRRCERRNLCKCTCTRQGMDARGLLQQKEQEVQLLRETALHELEAQVGPAPLTICVDPLHAARGASRRPMLLSRPAMDVQPLLTCRLHPPAGDQGARTGDAQAAGGPGERLLHATSGVTSCGAHGRAASMTMSFPCAYSPAASAV